MTRLNGSGSTSDGELEKKPELGQQPNHREQDGDDIEGGTNHVTEPSPRQIHGWKVCQPIFLHARRECILTTQSVGNSIRFHVIHDISLLA